MSNTTTNNFATTPPRMTVLSDHAIHRESGLGADDDNFDLQAKLGMAFDILRHKDTQAPVTVALYGDWGMGKTSGMRWLRAQLDEWTKLDTTARDGHPRTRTIWFEPWKYQTREEVWRGLIAEVILKTIDVQDASFGTVKLAVQRFGRFLGRGFLNVLASTKVEADVAGVGGVEVGFDSLKGIVEDFQATNHPEKAYLNDFENTFKNWVATRLGDDERMVIFIDDLDRCLPQVTLEVLESLKLYLNIPKLVFVVGLDRTVVDAVVTRHYADHGVDAIKAEQYLDKIFQVEVDISPSQQQMADYIAGLTVQLDAASDGLWHERLNAASEAIAGSRPGGINVDARQIIEGRIQVLCRDNPREVKRLLNSTLMAASAASRSRSILGSEALRFTQGAQVYLLDRFIRRNFKGALNQLLRAEVQEFFSRWSDFLDKYPKFRPSAAEDIDGQRDVAEESEVALMRGLHGGTEPQSNAETQYEVLRDAVPEYTSGKDTVRLNVLDLEVFWVLMQIPFRGEVAAFTVLPEVTPPIGRAERSQDGTLDHSPGLSLYLRNLVAHTLSMPVEKLQSADMARIKGLSLLFDSDGAEELQGIELLSNLTQLSFSKAGVTNTGLMCIKNLRKLTTLDLAFTNVTNEGLEHISELANLTSLNLRGIEITNVGLSCLAGLSNLTTLGLSRTGVTDEGLKHLSGLANLTKLYLMGTGITDVGLAHLEGLKNLTYLDLLGTGVIGVGLVHLTGMSSLKSLDLSRTAVTDERLEHLAGLSSLSDLNLSGTVVTNAGLKHFFGLTNLRELRLVATGVTDLGLDQLRAKCPNLRVIC